MDGLDPREIQLEVKKFSVTAKVPLTFDGQQVQTAKRATFNLKLEQFPLNIANARTAHKLQGRTIENLVISNWSMQQGWACVALSRVRTLKGVCLRKPLDRIRDAGMNGDLRKMLHKFRQEVDVTPDGTCDTT